MSLDQPEVPNNPQGIHQVRRIMESSVVIGQRDVDIPRYIEEPLREAAVELYDRNIQSYMSSANPETNPDGVAHISIYTDSLSDSNREILEQFIEDEVAHTYQYDGQEFAKLEVKVDPKDPDWAKKVTALSVERARRFGKQPFTWCPRHTAEKLGAIYGYTPEEARKVKHEDWEESGYIFDPKTGLYFQSQEHVKKFHDSMNTFNHDKHGNPIEQS